jgi:thioredoxin-related protein
MKKARTYLLLLGMILPLTSLHAQDEGIRWLNFEQLEDSLATAPRKVFIDFYADWCVYCKKMDRVAFRDPEVISRLNTEYYAVRMNAETSDTIVFDGQLYTNPEFGEKRNPVHEIPLLLASREGVPFSLPAIVILDETFHITDRYFQYIPPKQMRKILRK